MPSNHSFDLVEANRSQRDSERVSSYIGQRFPWLSVYGSYLIQGDKW